MAKFRNTKKGEGKKANATSHNPRIKNPRRDDKKRSAPLSSKAPSTSYLRRSFSERTGEKRKGQPGTEKKVNRDEPGISHHTCNRCEEKKKRNKKENKNRRTGLDAGLADVDGNNLSHLLFKVGGIGCRRCSTRVRIAKTKVLMSLRFFLVTFSPCFF
jgi:hypothetical protein